MGFIVDAITKFVMLFFSGFAKSLNGLISPKGRQDLINTTNEFNKSVERYRQFMDSPDMKKELAEAGFKPEDFPFYHWDDDNYKPTERDIKNQSITKRRNKMAAKVFLVNYQNQADYKVCFVNYDNQQKNHQIIKDGKIVKFSNQADVKLFIVKYPNQADILITHKNFPK